MRRFRCEIAWRVARYFGRFVVLALALTGLLSLLGVPVLAAALSAFVAVDAATLVWLGRGLQQERETPRFSDQKRLTVEGWRDFPN